MYAPSTAPKEGKKSPTIVAKLNNRDLKNQLIRAAKMKKSNAAVLGYDENSPIFCDEHLTPETKTILFKAKALRKEGVLTYVWTRDCRVFVKESPESHTYELTSTDQLEWKQSQMEVGGGAVGGSQREHSRWRDGTT